ncbi:MULTISPECIES: response regulator [unclassified Flavobacterium]|uniref:response regulator n=1 Tax=unclassified Flavobacterium TaxID=196869 RepID=UPI003F922EF8
MFTKVIIADDIDFNDVGAAQVLKELNVATIDYAKYCDEALLKIKKSFIDNEPYELLITDLSFKADHQVNKLNSGEELIDEVKKLFPSIKIIAFSIEDRPYKIKLLFDQFHIDGYVMKGRNTISELKTAITKAFLNDTLTKTPELNHILQDKTTNEINDYDVQIIKHLSWGIAQEKMEEEFKKAGITPHSKSSIEKHINKLKIYFKANNTVHLVAMAKDLGII